MEIWKFLNHLQQITNFFKKDCITKFPGGSDGKESACNAVDPGSTAVLGRSPGEGNGYSLQYFWVSLIAPLIQGKEQQLCFAGAAVKRYPTPKVRET